MSTNPNQFPDAIRENSFSKISPGSSYKTSALEYKYYQLFNSIDEGYCVIDMLFDKYNKPCDYRFLEVNSAFELQTGLTDPIGKCVSEVAPSHEQYWFDIYGQVVTTGKPLRFQKWASEFNRHYDVYAFRIGAPDEKQVAVLFNDITEKKRAEHNLAFLFNITQGLLMATGLEDTIQVVGARMGSFLSLSCFLFSKANQETNDTEVLYNWRLPGTPDLVGSYKRNNYLDSETQAELLSGNCIIVSNTQTDKRLHGNRFQDLHIGSFILVPLKRNDAWQFSICLCRQDACEWRSDEISLIREAATNIWASIERKRIERDLYYSEERLRMAVAAGNIGICDLDYQTWETVCNPVRFAMYGMEPDTRRVSAEEFMSRTHPDDVEKLRRTVISNVEAEGKYKAEFRVVHPDSSIHWISETGQVTEWENGKPRRLISTLLDITQQKLEEQQRDDFFSIASHELKTPVTNLKAIAYLMKEHFAEVSDSYSEELLIQFEKQTDRLNRLILTMLDTAKAVIGKLDYQIQLTDVLPLLQEVVRDLQCTTPMHRLVLSSPSLPLVFADSERLIQVFTNIIYNAIKYTPASTGEAPKEIYIEAGCTQTELKITVADSGIGMSAGTVTRLFQRFFRSDNPETHKYPGSGLGLFIAKEIMQHHGGDISVESEKGKGSVFTMVLPLAAESSDASFPESIKLFTSK